ncbi:hypothetical protein [Curtobacterium sp. PhB136]|uniref:hypothetical protein n=1 Tax=Curtobacterium sp. PhB136 TaxID=2485181 RepID=UPI001050AA03|nr:hypothetical protein [Curtobacterium sp. PhB136]TCK66143.1 hypothetical protein EDF27_0895 [Curtobacterium sp. PhB136]
MSGPVADTTGLEARPSSVALLTAAIGRFQDPAAPVTDLAAALAATVADAPPGERDDLVFAAVSAVLPVTHRWLRSRGLTAEQADASIADVARKRDRYGVRGTGLDWFCAVATGRVVAVGRLQFELGAHLADGTPAWGVHVPETGPLDPVACDRAFAAAPDVLRRLAPQVAATVWNCRSWTLDPGLADVLGPDANLVRFARRFTLLPPGSHDAAEGDDSAAKFVFGTDLATARATAPRGRVQAAVRARWDAGAHWTERTGTAPVG